MIFFLFFILIVSSITFFGSYYLKKYNRNDLMIGFYVLFTSLSQIIASKIAYFDLGFVKVSAPAATIIFSVTFLITDIVNEKFGRKEVHRMIFISFVAQIAMILFILLATFLEPAPFWNGQEAWLKIFSLVPRITIASLITFLISENLDAYLFHLLKIITSNKYLWIRNFFSSAISLSLDTILFAIIAFYGTGIPLFPVIVGQFLIKYFVAILDVPFMYINRWIIKN